jgi:SPFH domain / Band 7 family
METLIQAGADLRAANVPSSERKARYLRGIPMLVLGIAPILGAIAVFWASSQASNGVAKTLVVFAGILVLIAAVLTMRGLTPVVPGRAHVVQLFGKYTGTIREPGLQWVNPFTTRVPVSTRIRNEESSLIATQYPYDSRGTGAMSLRENAEEITDQLSDEVGARVVSAGVKVIETRLTRLSYAPEIAQAMLRQQQASAVVGARQRIVEGAVGMVRLALERLEEEGVVELDEERKAAMVSNLLVALCSEQATQQVVNTGSLYQ